MHEAWKPLLRQEGWETTRPGVFFYQGDGAKSACGYVRAPAFYCAAGKGSVFFGDEHFQMARSWNLSVNEMVNHEYTHHLQNVSGLTDARSALSSAPGIERRAELQAVCMSAMMTYHNESVAFGPREWASWNHRLDTMLTDRHHGTRASLRQWGLRGLYARAPADCNTWVARENDVA